MRELMTMFVTIFVAELGDKTQVATVLFASEGNASPWAVFAASAGALALGAAVSVIVGTAASHYLERVPMKLIAGIGFMLIGAWTIVEHYRG